MTDPGGCQSYLITIPRDEDLHKAIEIIRPLRVGMVLQNVPTLRKVLLDAAIMNNRASYTKSKEPLTDAKIDAIAQRLNLGRWSFYGALYGPEPIRQVMWQVVKASFSQIPGTKFYFPEDMPENSVLQTRNSDSKKRALKLISTLVDDAAAQVQGEYRTHLTLMGQIADTYSFNDNAQMRLKEKIKNALDSKGIIAPGKNGIWPANCDKSAWRVPI